eukprot:5763144-Amphidinium_carterae.1
MITVLLAFASARGPRKCIGDQFALLEAEVEAIWASSLLLDGLQDGRVGQEMLIMTYRRPTKGIFFVGAGSIGSSAERMGARLL